MRPRRSRSSGGNSPTDADSTSRLLLALLGFALVVFASTICLLAAGLAAHIDDEELNAGVEGRLQGGAAGGGVVQQQQEVQYLEQELPIAAAAIERAHATNNDNDGGAVGNTNGGGDIGGIIRGADAAKKTAAAISDKPLDTMAAAAQNAIFPTVVSDVAHLNPSVPYLPPHAPVPNPDGLIETTLSGSNPTMAGIHAILQRFLLDLHESNRNFATDAKTENDREGLRDRVVQAYFDLANKHLIPFDKAYRGKNIFPVREDGSIFMSLASFRDHLLGATLKEAFRKAEHPERLFVGAVVQNCFGDEYVCKTGAQVVGKDKNGRPQTKVSDAPPDKNGVEEFCTDPSFKKYCEAGQIRALYVNETESLGPAAARYYASKLWGGETYYLQADAHLRFAPNFDTRYIDEVKAAKAYPKAVLSSYPPGFSESDPDYVGGTTGARLCTCEFSHSDVEEHIIRINTGGHCTNDQVDGPTQIAFIAAGFFFARAEFLKDVPFDPYLPWCFMGEEIALSSRAWTSGWDIYAPRQNLIAHQYRPGRMGLPKFWGSVGRLFGRPGPGFNTRLQKKIIKRVKNLVGYPEVSTEEVEKDGDELVLTDLEFYGMGSERTRQAYVEFTNIDFSSKSCKNMQWCNKCTMA